MKLKQFKRLHKITKAKYFTPIAIVLSVVVVGGLGYGIKTGLVSSHNVNIKTSSAPKSQPIIQQIKPSSTSTPKSGSQTNQPSLQTSSTSSTGTCPDYPSQARCVAVCTNLNNKMQGEINTFDAQSQQQYEQDKAAFLNAASGSQTASQTASTQEYINNDYQNLINSDNSGYQNAVSDIESIPCPVTITNPSPFAE